MRGINILLPVHDGSKFTWADGKGCAEASDLGDKVTGRVWTDSCDEGFWVRSARTGQLMLFTLQERLLQGEEIVAWEFVSYRPQQLYKIVVFND